MIKRIDDTEKPKREGFFALTSRLNKLGKEQKTNPRLDDETKEKVEKKDVFAMIISAFLTLFIPAVLVLGFISVVIMAIFGVFS